MKSVHAHLKRARRALRACGRGAVSRCRVAAARPARRLTLEVVRFVVAKRDPLAL
jgi:hypothetical protein